MFFVDIKLEQISGRTAIKNRDNAIPVLDPGLIAESTQATTRAHEKFLEFSKENMKLLEKQFQTLTRLADSIIKDSDAPLFPVTGESENISGTTVKPPFLNREQCLEYAVGKAGSVLGKAFDIFFKGIQKK